MTRIVFTRHGETVWHAENRYAGSSDISLTTEGEEQARQLARWASTQRFESLWSSDLGRTQQTAAPSSTSTGLQTTIDKRLRELDFGSGEGLTTAEMRQRFPEARAAFEVDPVAHHLPEGENPHDAIARAMRALNDIAASQPEGRVLIIFHSTLMRLVLCHLLGIPPHNYRQVFPSLRNCAITEISLSNNVASLLEFNTPVNRLTP